MLGADLLLKLGMVWMKWSQVNRGDWTGIQDVLPVIIQGVGKDNTELKAGYDMENTMVWRIVRECTCLSQELCYSQDRER